MTVCHQQTTYNTLTHKNADVIMQTLLKNLFNLMNLLKISLMVLSNKIFQKPSVKGTLRYQKINSFTTSALSRLTQRPDIFLKR
jgi:hypothetical protein